MEGYNYTGPYLTAADIEALNAARIVLRAMSRTVGTTQGDALVYAKAESAGSAIFDLLNTAKHQAGVEAITKAHLHLIGDDGNEQS